MSLTQRAAVLGFAVPGVLAMRAAPGCRRRRHAQATPKPGGTLTAIVVDDPKFLDIHVTQLAQSRNIMASIYETLTYIDAADPTFPIKGRLATEWAFTEPTKLDFKLQPGVKFHNGEDFTADDVKFTIEYVKNPDTASPNAAILDQIDTVEVLDPLTVRLNLKQPWPATRGEPDHDPDLLQERNQGFDRDRAKWHRPVRVERVDSGRPHHDHEESGLLGCRSAISRRDRASGRSRKRRRASP